MAGTALDPARHLIAVGVTDRSATPEISAHLFAEEPNAAAVLERVRAAGVGEALVLTTCERVEVIAAHQDPALAERSLLEAIAGGCGIDPGELAAARRHVGEAALRHVFAVAASLESAMIGDPQILGQLKESHRRAADAGAAGPALDSALRAAYAAARRVRAETALAEGPVSIAASAQLVARDVHGDLRRRRALLIGLGEIGEFLGGELKAAGVRDMVVIHASPARAEAAARRLGCHFRALADLDDALAAADIVISATGAGTFTVAARAAEAALVARRREP
ncbi:MAG: NAD(P)-binding domain-containing protein, partial [Kiloniellaceae bacterium]